MMISERLEKNRQTREDLLLELYEVSFPAVARFVKRMNGTLEDAKDIFHDALVIFYERERRQQLHLSVSPQAYLIGISKHLWIRKFNKDRLRVEMDDFESALTLPVDFFPEKEGIRLLGLLERAGKKCMELLKAFYYDQLPLKEITNRFSYSSVRSSTVQKYKCLEKVRDLVKEKAISYEDISE